MWVLDRTRGKIKPETSIRAWKPLFAILQETVILILCNMYRDFWKNTEIWEIWHAGILRYSGMLRCMKNSGKRGFIY